MDELKGSVPIAWPILMQRKSAWFEDGYLKIGFTQSGFVDQLNTANLKNEVAQALKRIDPTLKLGFVHLRYQEDFSELNNLFGNMLDFENSKKSEGDTDTVNPAKSYGTVASHRPVTLFSQK